MSSQTVTLTQAQLDELLAKAVSQGKALARGRTSYPGLNEALDKSREANNANKGRLLKATFDPATQVLVLAIAVEKHEVKSAGGQAYLCSMGTGKGPCAIEVEGFGRVTTRGWYMLAE